MIQFTNGLKVYLSGDTGLHAEMKAIVNEFHKVNLVMFNLGPNAVTTPSAAYAINELVRPAAVIVTHVNEGATVGGKVRPDIAHRGVHEPGQGPPGVPRAERQDDGVRRRREVRRRLLGDQEATLVQPAPEQRELGRIRHPRRVDEPELPRRRRHDVEEPHQDAVANVVAEQ